MSRDVLDIWFWLAGYPAVFYYPVLFPAKMSNGNALHHNVCLRVSLFAALSSVKTRFSALFYLSGYRNWIFYRLNEY